MKTNRSKTFPFIAAACLGLAQIPQANADSWIGGAYGDWNVGANWNNGVVPNGIVAEVINGTAVISNTVPTVIEAWAGNAGVAGNIIITNGGVLPVNGWMVVSRPGAGANTPLSSLTMAGDGTINKWGDAAFIVGDGNGCRGILIMRDNSRVNVTQGWNQVGIGWGNYGEGWVYLQDNAVFDTPGFDINIGDWGDGKGHFYIRDNASLRASRFWLGKWDNTVGALWQTGGSVVGTGSAANEWCLGGEGSGSPNAFGFYNLAGGTLNCPFNFQVGRYGKGIFYQSGGVNTQEGWCDTARFAGSLGITWVSGGHFNHIGTGTRYMVGENGRGEVTVSGTGILETAAPIMMANGTAYLTLNGGTLAVPEIGKWGGTAYLNLNGGTIKPKVSNPNFISAVLTEARVYAGGAVFDTDGKDITINQALLDSASTSGLLSIPVTDGGAGYVAPPVVQVTGDGIGALALAQIDPDAGKVTNIIVTCPGYGYFTPSVTLIGGGATTPATLGTPTVGNVVAGGLTKNGAGTLVLKGQNTYTGPTIVNGGKLILTPDTTGSGSYTVASGAGLGVTLLAPNSSLLISSGTLNGSSLDFDLGNFGNPSNPALNVQGTLNLSGSITINVADALPQIGSFPLVQFNNRTGSGSFVLGSVPLGVQAHLATNSPNTLDLVITGVGLPRWDGRAGGVWDINLTTNWTELSTGLATYYKDGAAVLFDDAALGVTTVNISTTVLPSSVKLNNSTLPYTFSGVGKISGTTGLTKQGTGSLTIANISANDFTGPMLIQGGTVSITRLADGGVGSDIGASAATSSNLVLANGTLSYSGAPTAINRGYSIQDTNASIEVQADLALRGSTAATVGSSFVKRGPAKLSYTGVVTNELSGGGFPGYNVANGTVIMDGSAGPQVNNNAGEFWIGGSPDYSASLILSNTTFNVDSWLAVARGNGSLDNVSSFTAYDSKVRTGSASSGFDGGLEGNLARQFITLNGTSTWTNNGDMNLAERGGSTSTIQLNNNSALYSGWRIFLGWNGGSGSLTLANSSFLGVNAWFSIGHEGGNGSVLMKDNSRLWALWDVNVTDVGAGTGTFTIQDSASVEANKVFVGKGEGSAGIWNQNGGSVLSKADEFQIGGRGQGTWNQVAGTVNSAGWTSIGRNTTSVGEMNFSGGTFIQSDAGRALIVGEEGVGTLNLSGTALLQSLGSVRIGSSATATGTLNLNGGTLEARQITSAGGSSTLNFNGGLLRARTNANPDFINGLVNAMVLGGGAKIDSGSNNIAVNQALLDGTGGGGLIKTGTGALYLNGANTYTGATLVNAGYLGGNGVIAGPVTVAANAGLAPGTSVGVLTVNNSVSLAGGSTTVMEIDKANGTNDQLIATGTLSYGGTLAISLLSPVAAGDTFKLFTAGTYAGGFTNVTTLNSATTWDTSSLNTDGTVKVISSTPTTPTNITAVVSNGNMTISWPSSYIGWRLLTQNNPLTIGLSNNWTEVPGSASTNQVIVPTTASGTVFFRLVYP